MPGMNASDAPTVDELLLVAEGSVEFLFGTSRAALLQISLPLSTSESKAWLSSQNVDAKLAKVGRAISAAGIEEYALFLLISETVRGTIAESISRSRRSGGLGVLQRSLPRTIVSRRQNFRQCRRWLVRLCNNWTRRSQSQTAVRRRRCPSLSQ